MEKNMKGLLPRGRQRAPEHYHVSTLTLRIWEFTGTALLNLLVFTFVAVYLSPLAYMLVTSLKSQEQLRETLSPIWPAERLTFTYNGKTYALYKVPTETGVQQWALVRAGRTYSEFIDPEHPEAGLIRWEGSWRSLEGVYRFKLDWSNFAFLFEHIDYRQLLKNTLTVALISEVGVLLTSIAVAYGFSRFRIPGGRFLFFLLIATIMIPDSITLVPSFFIYTRVLKWGGTFLPLLAPHFFGNAIFIFLLRQNFKSIPRDLDEAAMLDGAGPLRILTSIIAPQAMPAIITIALLHFFYIWNELRFSSLYLSTRHDLWTMSFSGQAFQTYGFTPEKLQASAVIILIIPILILFLAQRFFMRDLVVTGLEK